MAVLGDLLTFLRADGDQVVTMFDERRDVVERGLDVEHVADQLHGSRKLAQRRRHRGAPPKLPGREIGAPILARVIAEDARARTGVKIHPGAGVVIGETAVIRRNVRNYQAVTLGARRFETDPATGAPRKNYPLHPIVEDDVVIYAGATILGRVVIGKGSSIGGNVWLTHDAPAGSQVARARGGSVREPDGTLEIDREES